MATAEDQGSNQFWFSGNGCATMTCGPMVWRSIASKWDGGQLKRPAMFPFAVVLSALATPAVADTVNIELEPASDWYVNQEEKSCRLVRWFGEEATNVLLQIEMFAPGATFQIIALGEPFRGLAQGDRLQIQYGENPPIQIAFFFRGSKVPSAYIPTTALVPWPKDATEVPVVTPEMEAAVTTISYSWWGKTVTLKTGPMDKPFGSLRTCTDNLLKQWGLDPDQQRRLSSRPTPLGDPRRWIQWTDDRSYKLHSGRQGLVSFRLIVGADGKIEECDVQRSYSDIRFDRVTCKAIMKRARFKPAFDAEGVPTRSFYANTVSFYIPRYAQPSNTDSW